MTIPVPVLTTGLEREVMNVLIIVVTQVFAATQELTECRNGRGKSEVVARCFDVERSIPFQREGNEFTLVAVGCSVGAHWYLKGSEHGPETEWSYEGETGPEHWGDLDPSYRLAKEGL